jgi:hypothetical protein
MDPIKDVKLRITSPEYFATVEKVLRRAFLMLLNLLTIAAYGQAQTNPQVDQPMASATFVNIYWDSSWDADNPSLTKETLDLFTQKIERHGRRRQDVGLSSVLTKRRLNPK